MNARSLSSLVLAVSLSLAACDDGSTTEPTDRDCTGAACDDDTGSGGAAASVVDCAADAASLEAAKVAVLQQRIAASNAQDWDTWESLHTPDAFRTAPELDGPIEGAAGMRAAIEHLFVTFPDYHLELVEAFGEGDRMMARIHAKGTMLGPMEIDGFEIPPTGMAFEQDWVAVLTYEGDKISAILEFYDNYGTMIQLGLAE